MENSESYRGQIISCIGMPGKQSISRYTCARRYLLAQKIIRGSYKTNHELGQMSSLEICRNCLEGNLNAKRFKEIIIDQDIDGQYKGESK